MILDDFAYFKYDSTYNEFATNPGLGISEGTIVFVEDTGNIYARGHQFGGKYEYQGEDGVIVDGNTITLDIDYINENLMPDKTVYTAGNYINISNANKISVDLESLKDALGLGNGSQGDTFQLKPAEANVLGGIKIGYEDNGLNYRIQLDGNNRAFVHVPWTDTKPTTPETPTETGVTKEYVDQKVDSLTNRLNDIVSEINWDELFDEYGVKPKAGQEVDPEESTITQWVHDPDNIALVWQQLTASNAKPSWVSVVATKYDEWITGTQIQQLENQISLIAGNFDSNGDPIEGKWSGIILTAKDEHGKSVIDLAADQVIASGEIVTPAVVSTAINAEDITVTSKLTATNADIIGKITATSGEITNCNITNCTVSGDLQYSRIIGAVQNNINQSSEISNNVALAIITGRNITVRFPSQPVEGQTLYVKHIRPSSDGGSLLLPNEGQSAFMYAWKRDNSLDDESSQGYSFEKQNITYSYNPSIPVSLKANMNDDYIHQYIYSNGIWYELTSGFDSTITY